MYRENDIITKKLKELNAKTIALLESNPSLDLIHISLYFYYISRLGNNKEYEKLAKKYLDEVAASINTIKSVDIKHGLAGIGLGIDYLVKNNFVKGNINNILQEIDDYLFRTISVAKHYETLDTLTMLQVLYYFYVRLKDQSQGSENEYLFKEQCIDTINNIYSKIEKTAFGSRLAYNIEYELPLFLYVLSKISSVNFYNRRVTNILKELSPTILSTVPILHCNKLYLLWAMLAVKQHINIEGWNKHINLLKQELDLDEIINNELKNRNIFFNDGATSIFLLAEYIKKDLDEEKICIFQEKLLEKIEQSEVWYLLEDDPQYFEIHNGLYDGFCGVALLLMIYGKNNL
jgi:hypothetical protein